MAVVGITHPVQFISQPCDRPVFLSISHVLSFSLSSLVFSSFPILKSNHQLSQTSTSNQSSSPSTKIHTLHHSQPHPLIILILILLTGETVLLVVSQILLLTFPPQSLCHIYFFINPIVLQPPQSAKPVHAIHWSFPSFYSLAPSIPSSDLFLLVCWLLSG